ncbi:MFS transporter [Sphingomonas sp. M1-B02]|uniref:MFS transporter n=1 Tax=Sphingomonas sp. M1-B02 TaxID=3114300 RepID=UPI002240332F|nr:MFS transporter [Sphingomonas sp. S6-11]UZK66613.1 MFS transporter [Sphingomonas sp. S6-11]
MTSHRIPKSDRLRLGLFAFGDFAFNLYWQSATLFLLFYYTEVLRLSVGWAATTYMIALVWDGLVSLAVGMWADRHRAQGYRRYLTLGAVPLGLSFMLAYLPPMGSGGWAAATVLATHLLFRTAYAAVNIPYLAMTARISADSGDRALVAGLRMLFGTGAMVIVSLGTVPLGRWLSGGEALGNSYFTSAAAFSVVGAAILLAVGWWVPERTAPMVEARISLRTALANLAANRAFVTLNAAMAAVTIASIFLSKSVLYYYKYELGDEAAGQLALAAMGVVGAIAVPFWTIVCRRAGARATWFAATLPAALLLGLFAAVAVRDTGMMRLFLVAIQLLLIGLHIAFWAMLPNTVEWGERETGTRLEGAVFGLATLVQRSAIGLATGLFGLTLDMIGYRATIAQSAETLEGLRLAIGLVPLACVGLSIALMAANPLRRRAHAELVAELERRG